MQFYLCKILSPNNITSDKSMKITILATSLETETLHSLILTYTNVSEGFALWNKTGAIQAAFQLLSVQN